MSHSSSQLSQQSNTAKAQNPDCVIELRNISLQYSHELILSNINLKVEKGNKLVIIGPSGQGKSSLLKIMSGIISPSQGEVFVEGKQLSTLKGLEQKKLYKKMGMLFQKNALFDSLTVGENIAFPLREAGHLSEDEIDQRVDYYLSEVGIAHAKNLFPDEMSGGMQKRLGIARALALDPEIVFYDDPTAGLDPITSLHIIALIKNLAEKNKSTVVAITNDMNRAYQLADQIAMVVDTELLITGNKEETLSCTEPRVHQFVRGSLTGPLTKNV